MNLIYENWARPEFVAGKMQTYENLATREDTERSQGIMMKGRGQEKQQNGSRKMLKHKNTEDGVILRGRGCNNPPKRTLDIL